MESVMPYVSMHVDLSDFDEEDMVEHLRDRGYYVEKPAQAASPLSPIMDVYEALKFGRPDAMDKVRQFVMDETGRVL